MLFVRKSLFLSEQPSNAILLSCLERKLKKKWQTVGALFKKVPKTTNMQSVSTWFKWSRSVRAKENMFFSVLRSLWSRLHYISDSLSTKLLKKDKCGHVSNAKLNFVINVSLTSTSQQWTENTRYRLFVKLCLGRYVSKWQTSCTKYVTKMEERGKQWADTLSRGSSLVSDM